MPKIVPKSRTTKIRKISQNGGEISNLILENTVALQRNLVETTEELKNLNIKLTRLLEIFEKANRTFEDSLEKGTETDVVELEKKIDALVEQNRIIAKGLLLLEKSTRSTMSSSQSQSQQRLRAQQEFEEEGESQDSEEEDKSDYSF